MVENNVKREPMKRMEREQEPISNSQAAGAPWWLVIVLILGLVGMASYIAWLNSATLKNRMNYVSEFLDSRNSEAELLLTENEAVVAWEDTLMNDVATDTMAQGWKISPDPTLATVDTEPVTVTTSLPTTPEVAEPSPVIEPTPIPVTPAATKSVYYIKAGEFTSKRAALFRISELRQGNYRGKIIEPDSEGGRYVVSVGEFNSFKKAKERARAIGFIMDIRTSVVKNE